MYIFVRETAKIDGARINLLKIADSEIDIVRKRLGLLTPSRDVYQRENYGTAIYVVPRGSRNSSARIVKQLRIKLGRPIEVVNLKDYSE
jgi:F420-0:gamma-glutamyl ligase